MDAVLAVRPRAVGVRLGKEGVALAAEGVVGVGPVQPHGGEWTSQSGLESRVGKHFLISRKGFCIIGSGKCEVSIIF